MIADMGQYEFTNREQMVSNEDYDYEFDCTAVALSSPVTPFATAVSETVQSETSLLGTIYSGWIVRFCFISLAFLYRITCA